MRFACAAPRPLLLLLLLPILDMASAEIPPPSLPKQLPEQAALVKRAGGIADATRGAMEAELLTLLGDAATLKYLQKLDDGSGLHLLAPEALLAAVRAELRVAEVVHAFGWHDDGNCGLDVTLDTGIGAPYFYNQWMLQALGMVPVDVANNPFTALSETQIFGYPPFSNVSAPDVNTSSSRMVYGALNMLRSSAGNPQCGPVSAVFSRGYIGDQAIVAPLDTGFVVGSCTPDFPKSVIPQPNCSAWPVPMLSAASGSPTPIPIATPEAVAHLLVPFVRFYNATSAVAGEEYAHFNLARVLTRLLSRYTYRPGLASPPGSAPLKLNWFEGTLGYLEQNPAVTIDYEKGIKFLIGAFDIWFGTKEGEELRKWCIDQSWPLVWAHDPVESTFHCNPAVTECDTPPEEYFSHGVEEVNVRVLDPFVLQKVPHGANITTNSSDFDTSAATFEKWWSFVGTQVPSNLNLTERAKRLNPIWEEMVNGNTQISDMPRVQGAGLSTSALALEPLFAGACRNEECIGVRIMDDTCVCPDAENIYRTPLLLRAPQNN